MSMEEKDGHLSKIEGGNIENLSFEKFETQGWRGAGDVSGLFEGKRAGAKGFHEGIFDQGFGGFSTLKRKRKPEMNSRGMHSDAFTGLGGHLVLHSRIKTGEFFKRPVCGIMIETSSLARKYPLLLRPALAECAACRRGKEEGYFFKEAFKHAW